MTMIDLFKNLPDLSEVKPSETKVILITHNDLDGVGCAVILKQYFVYITVITSDNSNMSQTISDVVRSVSNGVIQADYIFVTDLSPTLEDAANIEFMEASNKLILIDHHQTASYLSHYKWAVVAPFFQDGSAIATRYFNTVGWPNECSTAQSVQTSATGLLYEYLVLRMGSAPSNVLTFAQLVTMYDSWAWKNQFNLKENWDGYKMNRLLYLLGAKAFIEQFTHKLNEYDPLISSTDELMLKSDDEKCINYIADHAKHGFETYELVLREDGDKIESIIIGYDYAEQYIPQLFERLELYFNGANVDVLAITNGKKVSLRPMPGKNIDVGRLAQLYLGGGHPKAGGFPVLDNIQKENFKNMFTR